MATLDESALRSVLESVREHYCAGAPFRQDRDAAPELLIEAEPAAQILLHTLRSSNGSDPSSPQHREGFALLGLLGRRSALLGATPTAALNLVPGLLEGLERVGCSISKPMVSTLEAVFVEGYVAALEERAREQCSERLAAAVAWVAISPRSFLLPVAGSHEADSLREAVERFGRALFEVDARGCVVDIARLADPRPDVAAEIFSVDASARLLGAVCVFTGVSAGWMSAAREARVPIEVLTFEPNAQRGIQRVLEQEGLGLEKRSALKRLWTVVRTRVSRS